MKKIYFRRCLVIMISLVLLFGIVPIGTVTASETNEFAGGSGTTADPYLIENKEQLNNVRNYLNANFKMIADIYFDDTDFADGGAFYNNGIGWEPIGSNPYVSFSGTFDGNGFSVSGLYINASHVESDVYIGMFGYMSGMVQNLTIIDSEISVLCDSQNQSEDYIDIYVGTLAGWGNAINCHNYGTVDISYKTPAIGCYIEVGGIIGYGSAVKCSNFGDISAVNPTTGTGYIYISAGGIVGHTTTSELCKNSGNIYVDSERTHYSDLKVGGIAGVSKVVNESYNLGSITVPNSSNYNSAGGISGNGNKFDKCFNTGAVDAGSGTDSAGIVGYITDRGTISNCFNIARIDGSSSAGIVAEASTNVTVENCYNMGDIQSVFSIGYGIFGGTAGRSVINNCYCLDTASKANTYSTACTADEMLSKETYAGFDFDNVWQMDTDSDYQWPQLRNIPISGLLTDINECDVTISKTQVEYTESRPIVIVKDNGYTLEKDKDYFVEYLSEGIGNAEICIYGSGEYFKTCKVNYEIVKFNMANAVLKTPPKPIPGGGSVSSSFHIKNFVFDGTPKTQDDFRVWSCYGGVIPEEYYDISYKNNVNVGTATLVITGKGDYYTGTLEKEFKIEPRPVESIKIITLPTKMSYKKGVDSLDITGGEISVCYKDGDSETINITEDMVSGFDNSLVGSQAIRVRYGGESDTYYIRVYEGMRGDINGDEKITITDMLAVKAHILGKSTLTDINNATKADTNQDGKITITDFIQIKAHILGKSTIIQ